jgi:hypothetical protein
MPQEHEAKDRPASALSASLLKHFGPPGRRRPVTCISVGSAVAVAVAAADVG